METRAHYILIGAFTLGLGAAALLFGLWMSRATLDSDYRLYDIVFQEAVAGLSVGSPVQYSGIRVGEVERLTLDPEDPRQVWARVRVVSTAPVKVDTTARLALLNITGSSSIALSQGLPSSPLLTADNDVPGRFLPGYAEESAGWQPSTFQVRLDGLDLRALRAFWEGYRADDTYNLTNRNCSGTVVAVMEAGLEGIFARHAASPWFLLRLLLSPELWIAGHLRARAAAMAWTPGLVLDYARALSHVLALPDRLAPARRTS